MRFYETQFKLSNGVLLKSLGIWATGVESAGYWDQVRSKISEKATDIRRQGFVGAVMLPYPELEYGGIVDKLNKIDNKFKVRK